jgi:hypothetical protein
LQFQLPTDYDIYTLEGRIIVNQFVKDAVESVAPGQAAFKSAQRLEITIDQHTYDKKKTNYASSVPSVGAVKEIVQVPEIEKYFRAKKERLEESDQPLNTNVLSNDEFKKTEIKLNVIIPEGFKSYYLKNKKVGEYTLLSIGDFYRQDEFSSTYPETVKAIVIGENGVGDSVGLLLEKDDDYKLGSVVFEFLHETGEVELLKF